MPYVNSLFKLISVCLIFCGSYLILQVGKGLSKNSRAQKLALQHWLEAVSILFLTQTWCLFFFSRCLLVVADSDFLLCIFLY